jgi:SAM-dependent methyltransferase
MDPKVIKGDIGDLYSYYNNSLGEKLEIEARFGSFGKTFEPSINIEQYNRIYSFFNSKKEYYKVNKRNQKIIQYASNIKEIVEDGKSVFMEKKKLKTYDIKSYGVRVAFAKETPILDVVNDSLIQERVTERYRVSFSYKDTLIFDLDRTSEGVMSIEVESLVDFETFMKNINLILNILQDSQTLITEEEKALVLKHYKKIFSENKNKFIGIQPETLTLDKLIKEEDYACTKKLDGKRFVMLNLNNQCYLMSNNLQDFKKLPYTTSIRDPFLIDGELFSGSYYAFDLISTEATLSTRFDYIKKIFEKCKLYNEKFKTKLIAKEYLFGNLYNSLVSLKDTLNDNYEDGIIVIKSKTDYFNSFPLKWKKIEKLTIDFLIKKKDGVFSFYVQDVKGVTLFHKNKVSDEDYKKYKSSDIVECSYKDGNWVPTHARVDKKKPNFKTVAEDNMKAIKNPFDFEKIKNYSSRSRAVFYNLRRFHNFIKRLELENNGKGKEYLLDLASGKGGDFGKYRDIGLKYVKGYEIDKNSIEIAKTRIADITNDKKNSISIEVNYMDLNADEPPVPSRKFDVIVCNFAFHYFYQKIEHFIQILSSNAKAGTVVLLTFFDNEKIVEHDNINSKIVKVGDSEIDVYIKDSVLNKPTREHIVDKTRTIKLMSQAGFKLKYEKNFSEYYNLWSNRGNFLTEEEKLFSFMDVQLVFEM